MASCFGYVRNTNNALGEDTTSINTVSRLFALLKGGDTYFKAPENTVILNDHGHNYVGFYQKHNTGPLEKYPCIQDQGNLMKCSTSCIQAQFIEQETGKVYTYRDCGTYLLQEFGQEKFNLSYTQYAMILSDVDDADVSRKLMLMTLAVGMGLVAGLVLSKVIQAFKARHPRRRATPIPNVEVAFSKLTVKKLSEKSRK
ncbi:unnamed protein product [Heligmosomoides polygyrus]|uniref:CX domain-containing protein n=1 Tax=Heligmosomoides polygyrus TaxID=6339 RepID=A0A3P8BH20_HELPZ|nr:unnamed protein product [Heligmosomoides polygyrus]